MQHAHTNANAVTGLWKSINQTASTAIAQAINKNPSVINAPAAGTYGQEVYGWIYENSQGQYSYAAGNGGKPANLSAGGQITPEAPPTFPGETLVGWYHTHPYQDAQDNIQTDRWTGRFFSQDDIDYTNTEGPNLTGYVAVNTALSNSGLPPSPYWFSYHNNQQSKATAVGQNTCPSH